MGINISNETSASALALLHAQTLNYNLDDVNHTEQLPNPLYCLPGHRKKMSELKSSHFIVFVSHSVRPKLLFTGM